MTGAAPPRPSFPPRLVPPYQTPQLVPPDPDAEWTADDDHVGPHGRCWWSPYAMSDRIAGGHRLYEQLHLALDCSCPDPTLEAQLLRCACCGGSLSA